GKLIVIDFRYNNVNYRLINVHAPNLETQRKRFFENIRKWITHSTILIGDFNVTLTIIDISSNCVFSEDPSRNELFKLIRNNDLIDYGDCLTPEKKQYTRKQTVLGKLKQSRIDLCLMSSSLIPEVSSRLSAAITPSWRWRWDEAPEMGVCGV
uniref:Endonuclease/exonuclease/phosphatase domain-containing protein n=1 Tax=Cyprinodon variegatus TaxID=28743 RepID=A0A3Q2CYF9_CYPVA